MRQHVIVRRAQSGYSLVEMLTVVAIIGIVSLVTVPQFLTYQRNNQVKSSMRQVMNDIRLVRQQAIAMRTQARLRFQTGQRDYVLERLAPNGSWVGITRSAGNPTQRQIESNCTLLAPNGLGTVTVGGSTFNTVSFRSDGVAAVTGSGGKGTFKVRTSHSVPKPEYTIEVHIPGFVKAVDPTP